MGFQEPSKDDVEQPMRVGCSICVWEGRIWLRRRGTCRTDGRGGIGGRMMTCGRRWIEEPRLFDRKSDDFPSQKPLDFRPGWPSVILTPLPPTRASSACRRCQCACLRGRCHDAGARSWGWRTGGGLDSPGGQIGVRLLCVEGESVLEDGERGWIRLEGESA